MPSLVIVGAQWGDEGKGKVVDLYSQFADVAVRFSGGANAGHTLIVNGEKIITHLIPSGIVHANVRTAIMAGNMVIEPAVLVQEIFDLGRRGIKVDPSRLFISRLAHLVLPVCKDLDGLREAASGGKIGTTKRGIGQTFELKVGRVGIRFDRLKYSEHFPDLARAVLERATPEITKLGATPRSEAEIVLFLEGTRALLLPYVANVSKILANEIQSGFKILYEGAQGTELDIDHGTYPFVTSGNVVAPAAAIGTGLGMRHFPNVYGVTKAYTTRVGGGPFPTELKGELEERIRKTGGEYGATTGRPRRVGWLDLGQLRHAVRVNGLTGLVVTKLDVLRGIHPIKIALGYGKDINNLKDIDDFTAEELYGVEPLYLDCDGFDENIAGVSNITDWPKGARQIIDNIEVLTGVPVAAVSVGPSAEETIVLQNPLAEVDDVRTF